MGHAFAKEYTYCACVSDLWAAGDQPFSYDGGAVEFDRSYRYKVIHFSFSSLGDRWYVYIHFSPTPNILIIETVNQNDWHWQLNIICKQETRGAAIAIIKYKEKKL